MVKSPAIENGTSPRKKVTFQFSTLVLSAVESSSNCSELGIGIEAALSGVVSNKTSLNKTTNNRLVGSAITHIPASSGTLANVTASNRAASKSNELLQDQGNLLRGIDKKINLEERDFQFFNLCSFLILL